MLRIASNKKYEYCLINKQIENIFKPFFSAFAVKIVDVYELLFAYSTICLLFLTKCHPNLYEHCVD